MVQRRRLEISNAGPTTGAEVDVPWLELIGVRPGLPRVGQNTAIRGHVNPIFDGGFWWWGKEGTNLEAELELALSGGRGFECVSEMGFEPRRFVSMERIRNQNFFFAFLRKPVGFP